MLAGVVRVAVAVVVAFFICWAPFHAQRLMTIYIPADQWTPLWLELQSHLFYISGRHCSRIRILRFFRFQKNM